MKRNFSSATVCVSFGFLVAGCDYNIKADVRITSTQTGILKATLKRINDDVTLEMAEKDGPNPPEVITFKCSDQSPLQAALAAAAEDEKRNAAEIEKAMKNVTLETADDLLLKTAPLRKSQEKLSILRSAVNACDVSTYLDMK